MLTASVPKTPTSICPAEEIDATLVVSYTLLLADKPPTVKGAGVIVPLVPVKVLVLST